MNEEYIPIEILKYHFENNGHSLEVMTAWKLVEEKFKSTNSKSIPCCEQCGGETEIEYVCQDCGYYPGIE